MIQFNQKDSPGKAKDANWLPAPTGKFVLMLRIYTPRPKGSIDSDWLVEDSARQEGRTGYPDATRSWLQTLNSEIGRAAMWLDAFVTCKIDLVVAQVG